MSFVTPSRIPSCQRLGKSNSASNAAVESSLRSSLFLSYRLFLARYTHHRAAASGLRQYERILRYISPSLGILSLDSCLVKETLRSSLQSGGVSGRYSAQSGSNLSYRPGTDPRSTKAGRDHLHPRLNRMSTIQTFKSNSEGHRTSGALVLTLPSNRSA